MIELLLAHGADIEAASPDGLTASMIAAMFNRTEIVAYLMTHGANVEAKDVNGVSAIGAANRMGAPDTPAQLNRIHQHARQS